MVRLTAGYWKSLRIYKKYVGRMLSTERKEKRTQPPWSPPGCQNDVKLKLYNSLTRQKEVFVPQNGKRVLWYTCGPTVYDASHMGHARTYISLDILHRVMKNYFNYDVFFCMNVTDVDDKIIKRARQNYLYENYVKKDNSLESLLNDSSAALQVFMENAGKETNKDKQDMYRRIEAKVSASIQVVKDLNNNKNDGHVRKDILENFLGDCRDVLSDWLDLKFGSEVSDNSIFTKLPRFWEERFHQDMEALHVLPPDVLTRVTDYIPEIVAFIEKIISRKFAYVAGGSVYFDTLAFSEAEGHFYAKLLPEGYGDEQSLQEGEGVLSSSQGHEKRGGSDFALWKASKSGEPAWDSPWGKGRPGWHIECSVMASEILGESMDIHTGGFDLKFPHHDNEIAQSEAYFGNNNWVRYFLHTGHLTIQGCKMSKSLKNFVSIKDALEKHSACQLRLVFLLHSWEDTLDYSDNTMDEALIYEKTLKEFFLNVKDALRPAAKTGVEAYKKWLPAEIKLNSQFLERQQNIHECFCDSIDTRGVMNNIRELTSHVNVYISGTRSARQTADRTLLMNIASYITRMLQMFGAIESTNSVGFSQTTGSNTVNLEESVMPFLSALAEFRQKVRQEARSQKATNILQMCDNLRDDVLPELGVRLEDHEGISPTIKLVDREELMKEREEKIRIQEEKRMKKEVEKARLEQQRRIPPEELFIKETDKYSLFDARGIPTHGADGKELSKSQVKKLQKQYDAQMKKYKDYLDEQSNEGGADVRQKNK